MRKFRHPLRTGFKTHWGGAKLLESMLGNVPVTRFLNEYFLRLPFAMPGGCASLVHLGSPDRVALLVARAGADLVAGRQGTPWTGPTPTDAAGVRALLAAGHTLGVRHAERHDPDIAALAASFHDDFAAPIDVHVYCTPAGQPGFGWHYDAEDVFILQTEGRKEWELRKNTVNPWPLVETLPANMRHDRELMPLLRCTLAAGDWLYIPAGYWHRTLAEEESISLSVGVLSPTGMDVYDFVRPLLVESLLWRQRLPAMGRLATSLEEPVVNQYREAFANLATDLANLLHREETVQAFLNQASKRTSPPGA